MFVMSLDSLFIIFVRSLCHFNVRNVFRFFFIIIFVCSLVILMFVFVLLIFDCYVSKYNFYKM